MLTQDATEVGRWIDADVKGGTAHVLVVGVSEYPHLDGGTKALAPDNGGLGQLSASARTAAHVFDTIRKMSSIVGCEVASCRLCLSPGADEKAEVDALTGGNYRTARFDDIRAAIDAWGADILQSGRAGGENVAVFFFSGHGVEHLGSPALLASDILNPSHPNRGSLAIAHDHLLRSVKTLGIDRGLFLIDACRDAPEIAKRLHIVGREIIDPDADQTRSAEAMLSLMSTRQLFQSYQVAGATRTIYGEALLEALEGPPPSFDPYDNSSDPLRLRFGRLESHVKQRVKELPAQQTAAKFQPVSPTGDPYDGEMVVAVKPRPGTGGLSAGGSTPEISLPDLVATRSHTLSHGFNVTLPSVIETARAGERDVNDLSDYGVMHEIFGSEAITIPWLQNLHLTELNSGEKIGANTISIRSAQTKHGDGRLTTQLELTIQPAAGEVIWLSARGRNGSSVGITLPRDYMLPMPVLLELQMGFEAASSLWVVDSMSAWLAANETHGRPTVVWRRLFDIQQTEELADLGSAGRMAVHKRVLEKTLKRKRESPVAAAIATSILIRSNELDAVHDWPANLANWYDWLPDGSVLWAETKIRTAKRDRGRVIREDDVFATATLPEYEVAREYFSRLASLGAPRLTSTMLFAVGQLPFWRRVVSRGHLSFMDSQRLIDACECVERSAQALVSGSLFSSYSFAEAAFDPENVLGRKRRVTVHFRGAIEG